MSFTVFAKIPMYVGTVLFRVLKQRHITVHSRKEIHLWHYCRNRSFSFKTRIGSEDEFRIKPHFTFSANSFCTFNKTSLCFGRNDFNQIFKISSRRDFHPLVWLVVRPILKIAVVLGGRGFRKWWRDLPPDKKKYFLEILKRNWMKILAVGGVVSISSFIYYESHLQETPITKRRRFIVFTFKQSQEIADMEYKNLCEIHKQEFLHPDLPVCRRIRAIAQKLVDANQDLPVFHNKKWTVFVLNNKQENAFALPNGFIFVNSGMINLCVNDDQLAIIMAHEVAHCVLSHAAEQMSFTHIVDFGAILILAVIWAILPNDIIALFAHWLFNNFLEVSLHLPYSRELEIEADEVGVHLAAKACFDVRQSSAFWTKMAIINKQRDELSAVQWLSTHPTYEKRAELLDSQMDKALQLRQACGCPPLKSMDPRLDMISLNTALEFFKKKTSVVPLHKYQHTNL